MLLKIAWRNIWRSRTRSLVVIGAIIVGVWAVIFLISFSTGTVNSYVENAIQKQISHIQLHLPEYVQENKVEYVLQEPDSILSQVSGMDQVSSASVRTVVSGMLSSSEGTRGTRIMGVIPDRERNLTRLAGQITEGEYLDTEKRNPVLIGHKLAERLKLRLRSKVVLTFQNLAGDITAGAFRVAGIFDTGNNVFDESHVFVRRSDLNGLLGKEHTGHEIAILLNDQDQMPAALSELRNTYPELKVQSYKEISPELDLFESQIALSATIFTVIVMLALIFGIINTMLMAVLERIRELGMLMAIGMNKMRVFGMIMIETLLLGLISAPIGLLAGYLTVRWLNKVGINLSIYSEGMAEFGMSDIVYPDLQGDIYWELALSVMITALLASIYPSLKAIRLRPVDAIRKI